MYHLLRNISVFFIFTLPTYPSYKFDFVMEGSVQTFLQVS